MSDRHASRRVLVTGLSSHWGGRLASQLEARGEIEAIVGVDTADPRHELRRTEFVRVDVDADDALLQRIVRAAAIDTVVDTRLLGDGRFGSSGEDEEVGVLGIRRILAACDGADSPVRKLVLKSSAQVYGAEHDDPAFFTEDVRPARPPESAVERGLQEAESTVLRFQAAHPRVTVTILRFAPALGTGLQGPHLGLLGLPVVPAILGFDPRWQFIHEDDVIGVLEHAVAHDLPGVYNAAADGVLALSEAVSLLGKPLMPLLPPWGTVPAATQLRRLGLRVPVAMVRELRFGRGVDNRRLKASGYSYRYTSREAVQRLRAQQRLRPLLRSGEGSYRYEREVEEFLRRSPSVRDGAAESPSDAPPNADALAHERATAYDRLGEAELIDLISSLQPESLRQLREHEVGHRRRTRLLDAIDRQLELRAAR